MLFLRRLLRLPTPKELGMSPRNSLRSEWLTPHQEGPSWEDWHRLVQTKHPVRYFLAETLPDWFRPVRWWFRGVRDWVRGYTTQLRFRFVDLRGIDPLSEYRYGYVDPCEQMYLAAWGALRRFIEHEKPLDLTKHYTAEEIANEPGLREQVELYATATELYHYWMVERRAERDEDDRLHAEVDRVRHDKDAYEAACKVWIANYTKAEERAEAQFIRLCGIRRYLWT